jgi:hypothetical protein
MTTKVRIELKRAALLRFPEQGAVPYVIEFLRDRQYVVEPDCSITRTGGKTVPVSEIVVDLHQTHFQDRCQLAKKKKKEKETMPAKFGKEILEGALDLVLFQERDAHLQRAVERTAYDPSVDDLELKVFVKAVTGEEGGLTAAILRHWLANIKRRMLGLPVAYHIFPVLVGRQGGGKTTALQKLLAPIQWYTMNLSSVLSLADERNFKSISEKYVVVLDEMARADKTDAQILKGLITAENLSARALGTNRRDRLVANCSYVGTANTSVQSLIYDPSGMRRWFEVRCLDELDWEAINALNYEKVWRSVDPKADHLDSVRAQLREHQEELRQPSQAEEFVQDMGIAPGEKGNLEHRKGNDIIYDNYVRWAMQTGRRSQMDAPGLGRALKDLGFVEWKSGSSRGRWVKTPRPAVERTGLAYAEQGLEDVRAASKVGWNDSPSGTVGVA